MVPQDIHMTPLHSRLHSNITFFKKPSLISLIFFITLNNYLILFHLFFVSIQPYYVNYIIFIVCLLNSPPFRMSSEWVEIFFTFIHCCKLREKQCLAQYKHWEIFVEWIYEYNLTLPCLFITDHTLNSSQLGNNMYTLVRGTCLKNVAINT